VGFQVAGRIAEVATSKRWQALFDEHVVQPLGLTDTFFPANKSAGTAWVPRAWMNPHIGGGAHSTANDYARFLRMFLADGEIEGQRILSPRAVREMQIDQTLGLDPIFSPHWVADAGYGLGAWVETRGPHGLGTRLSCAGARGFLPWVDLELGYAGIIIAPCETRRLVRLYEALLPLIAQSLGQSGQAAA
jgi:CubicO group peptidase (beta-lactamase class C family)